MNLLYVLSICTAFIENLFFSGVLMGWPSLQFVLMEEGYFLNLCNTSIANLSITASLRDAAESNHSHFVSCEARDEALNLAFSLAASSPFIISLISGIVLDRYGTWLYRSLQTTMFSLSYVLFAVTSAKTSWVIFPASIMFGIAGNSLAISNIQVANLAGPFKGLVMSLLNGGFLAAAVVFMLVKTAYMAGIYFQRIFLILALLSGFTWVRTFLLMPRTTIQLYKPSSLQFGWKEWKCFLKKTKTDRNSAEDKSNVAMLSNENNNSPCDQEDIKLPKQASKSFKSCICCWMFWTNLFHFWVGHVRLTFFYGSFVNWIESFESIEQLSDIINAFGLISLLGILASPVCGIIFDSIVHWHRSKNENFEVQHLNACFIVMLITSVLLTSLSFTIIILQTYLSIVLVLAASIFVYSSNWTFLTVMFPIEHYGTLLGITQAIAGVGTILQFVLFRTALIIDPSFKYVNIGFMVLSCLTFLHPCWLCFKKYLAKKHENCKEIAISTLVH